MSAIGALASDGLDYIVRTWEASDRISPVGSRVCDPMPTWGKLGYLRFGSGLNPRPNRITRLLIGFYWSNFLF